MRPAPESELTGAVQAANRCDASALMTRPRLKRERTASHANKTAGLPPTSLSLSACCAVRAILFIYSNTGTRCLLPAPSERRHARYYRALLPSFSLVHFAFAYALGRPRPVLRLRQGTDGVFHRGEYRISFGESVTTGNSVTLSTARNFRVGRDKRGRKSRCWARYRLRD